MISVVIPAYRPRRDEIVRALGGLLSQSADRSIAEILLVDNNSPAGWYEAGVFPQDPRFRFVVETTPGLTPNRLRGFREAASANRWVLLVDQDNVLAPDYVEAALRVAEAHPFLGAIGGEIVPEYETSAPPFAARAPSVLSLRKVAAARWSNDPDHGDSTPWGAGMFLRREVVDAYAAKVAGDFRRAFLDHRGADLLFGADNDLANSALEIGLGKGVFPELRLTHLIPASRCTWDYYSRSIEGRILSAHVKDFLDTGKLPGRPCPRELLRIVMRLLSPDPLVRIGARAGLRGRRRARRLLASPGLLAPGAGTVGGKP